MISYHGKSEIKEKYLNRVVAHQKADEIIQGFYWKKDEDGDFKGCAVGCTIHGDDHYKYETELGIPVWLAKLEDKIFEGLSVNESKNWPALFLEAIPIGKDLNKVKIPFLIFIVESARENFDHKKYPKQLKAIDDILFELKKDVIDKGKLLKLRTAADYAAAAAAYAAAYAAADAAAAYAAAAAAAYAAAAAADAAAAAAAYAAAYAAAARENEYSKFAKKLIELLKGLA